LMSFVVLLADALNHCFFPWSKITTNHYQMMSTRSPTIILMHALVSLGSRGKLSNHQICNMNYLFHYAW
jgi:hypothetical protein